MSPRRELCAFGLALAALLCGYFGESLLGGKVLSPADVLFVSASFQDVEGPGYEPLNRLLTDPVLQFQPWTEFNRRAIRSGKLPLWNSRAGMGTPHLANAQSAVFDPFQIVAYLGPVPQAYAWIAFLRLWTAGVGMYLLARSWGLGTVGRWFAGLSFPLCGFLVVWLLYPVTSVAIWMPWLFLATDRVLARGSFRDQSLLALVAGFSIVGGHIQTTAQVLLGVGGYVAWRLLLDRPESGLARPSRRSVSGWVSGTVLGLLLGAVTIVPLAFYLARSPVWGDRLKERPSPLTVTSPRWLDSVCTAMPYAFGSQRRGHPNLARALGVHNLNESAGGYSGLATLLWLAPGAFVFRRENPRVSFLTVMFGLGFLAAFGFPPVSNVLRALPLLDVIDQRRMTLWVAFALVLLGATGAERVPGVLRGWVMRWWVSLWAAAGLALLLAAFSLPNARSSLESRASRHYQDAAARTEGASVEEYAARATRQVESTLRFLPGMWVATGLSALGLVALFRIACRGERERLASCWVVTGLTVADLYCFGVGMNPAIPPEQDRPDTAVAAALRRVAGDSWRVLGLGEDWPPNVAMRYGLSDVRNYDSVELSRNLDWLEPLFEPGSSARTSRRTVTWAGVLRALDRLEEAGVAAVVSAGEPPASLRDRSERIGRAYVTRLRPRPIAFQMETNSPVHARITDGEIFVDRMPAGCGGVVFRETYVPGWRAEADGRPVPVSAYRDTFLAVNVPEGTARLRLWYDPPEVRAACLLSLSALAVTAAGLLEIGGRRPSRFRLLGLGTPSGLGLESNS